MRKAVFIIGLLILPLAVKASVLITEVSYDAAGADSGQEWLELYNNSTQAVIIDSAWRFFDGSNHTLKLTQGSSTIESLGLAILADNPLNFLASHSDYSGNLFDTVININNSSSTIAISNDGSHWLDSLTFTSDWGAAGNSKTLELVDAALANEQSNWVESLLDGGTPG